MDNLQQIKFTPNMKNLIETEVDALFNLPKKERAFVINFLENHKRFTHIEFTQEFNRATKRGETFIQLWEKILKVMVQCHYLTTQYIRIPRHERVCMVFEVKY